MALEEVILDDDSEDEVDDEAKDIEERVVCTITWSFVLIFYISIFYNCNTLVKPYNFGRAL